MEQPPPREAARLPAPEADADRRVLNYQSRATSPRPFNSMHVILPFAVGALLPAVAYTERSATRSPSRSGSTGHDAGTQKST